MDRITKALQRACEARGIVNGRSRSLVPAEITYTKTRKVSLYPGWLRQNRITTGEAQDDYARAYKVLRTQVSQRMRQHGWKTLAVTSPGPGEGKTLTAINLSINLALESNHTVLLVDADLRQPGIHTYFGIEVEKGLRDHLLEGAPIEDILIHPEIHQLVLLPGGTPLINSSEMLSSPVMLQLVHELERRYPTRLVIFDLPPVLTTDDVLAFAPYVDSALLVVEEGKTLRDEVTRAIELLQRSNQNLIGTVLNKSEEKATVFGL